MKKIATYLTLLTGFACATAMAAEKGTIAILVNSLDNPYYSAEAKGAEAKAKSLGYQTLVLSHGEDVKRQGSSSAWLSAARFRASFWITPIPRPASPPCSRRKTPAFRWC